MYSSWILGIHFLRVSVTHYKYQRHLLLTNASQESSFFLLATCFSLKYFTRAWEIGEKMVDRWYKYFVSMLRCLFLFLTARRRHPTTFYFLIFSFYNANNRCKKNLLFVKYKNKRIIKSIFKGYYGILYGYVCERENTNLKGKAGQLVIVVWLVFYVLVVITMMMLMIIVII